MRGAQHSDYPQPMRKHQNTSLNAVPGVDQRAETPSLKKPYRVEEFGEKPGLSLKPAEVVLITNGPSQHESGYLCGRISGGEHCRRK
jgi:hypothetical protein